MAVVEQEITQAFYHGWYHECVDQLPPLECGFIRPGCLFFAVQLLFAGVW
jgi:hypothetical protein